MPFYIKAADRLPVLRGTLYGTEKDENNKPKPLDLTTASSVRLTIKQVVTTGTPVTWTKACTILDPLIGRVQYDWAVGDTGTAGTYEAEFEVTWNDGRIQHIPNRGNERIDVAPKLG